MVCASAGFARVEQELVESLRVASATPLEQDLGLVTLRPPPLRVDARPRADRLVAALQLRQRHLHRQVRPIPARSEMTL